MPLLLKNHPLLLPLLLLLLLTPTTGTPTPSLLSKLSQNDAPTTPAILALPSILPSALSNPVLHFLSGQAKASFFTSLLKQMTTTAQAPFINVLNSFGADFQPFYITNKIFIKNLDMRMLTALQFVPGVFTVREPLRVRLIAPVNVTTTNKRKRDNTPTWSVAKIGAPQLWPKTKGEGVLVANIDTGVALEHEALVNNYAGQWHDAMDHRPEPYDDNGHGTHVMGSICGRVGGIGVAPSATWIACKALGNEGGDETTLSECAQWILDLKIKPSVVANSWGGGQADNFFNDEIEAWRAVDIIPVFAIGNDGPSCSTAGSPGDQPRLISVGATQSDDTMARFSSRGPLKNSNKKTIKPEVSAPGQGITSAWPDGGYETLSGTSMACPHVAGAIALMRSLDPKITFDQVLKRLTSTTLKPEVAFADLKCGGSGGKKDKYPNNAYGWGIINVARAMGVK